MLRNPGVRKKGIVALAAVAMALPALLILSADTGTRENSLLQNQATPSTTPPPHPISTPVGSRPSPVLDESLQSLPSFTPQLQPLREALVLLGEGDRLAGERKLLEAREKWLAAVVAYQRAGDRLGESEAYLRLADSYQNEAIFDQGKMRLTVEYYFEAMFAAADVYETLIQKQITFDPSILDEAEAQFVQGYKLYQDGNCDQAFPILQEVRRLYHSIDFGSGELRALMTVARCQIEQEDYFGGLSTSITALGIAINLPLGTPTDELYLEAVHQFEAGQWQAAQKSFEQAIQQYREAGNSAGVAQATHDLAGVYAALGKLPEAEELYRQALMLFIEQDDHYNIAAANHNLANLALLSGDYVGAVETYQNTIRLWQTLQAPKEEVASRNGLGLALLESGDPHAALSMFQTAMDSQQHLPPDPDTEGDLVNNVGKVHYALGLYQRALLFQQSLDLRRQLPHPQKQAESLSNIASVQASLGRFDESLSNYEQVLELNKQLGLPVAEAKTRVNMASVQIQRGAYQEGISTYLHALQVFSDNGERAVEAGVHANVGSAYVLIGDLSNAEAQFSQALSIFMEINDPAGISAVQNNLGLLSYRTGDLDKAETFLQQALAAWSNPNNPAAIGRALGNLAIVDAIRGNPQHALEEVQQALTQSESAGSLTDQARLSIISGGIYLILGDTPRAMAYGQRAITLATQVGDPLLEMGGELILATGLYVDRDLPASYQHIQAALEQLDALQGSVTIAELKTSFLGQLADIYDLAVQVATELGRHEEAFQYAEQARARAFLDQLANGTIDFRAGLGPELLQRERALRDEIRALRMQLATLNNRRADLQGAEAIKAAEDELATRQKAYGSLLSEIKLQSPEASALISADALPLGEIQILLDADTTLVEYYVTEDLTLAFVVTRDAFEAVALSVGQAQLAQAITDFRQIDFADFRSENAHPVHLQELYQWLIAPLRPRLKTPLLGIVPHDVLHYLPFAALTNGERYLSDDYALFSLPSASMLRFIRDKHEADSEVVVALGNPAVDAPLSPLPFAEREARAVAELYGTEALVGAAATESAVRSQAVKAGILHLAAHGVYNPINPLFNAIHLAEDAQNDGRLEVHEIYGLDLFASTQLVVLSACETQIGSVSRGDEVAALNRAFLLAGTPSVVASLWRVDDEATAMLMGKFYQYLRMGLGKAEALRRAQLDIRAEYPHPRYWAAFVLTGDTGALETPGSSSALWVGAATLLGIALLIAFRTRGRRLNHAPKPRHEKGGVNS